MMNLRFLDADKLSASLGELPEKERMTVPYKERPTPPLCDELRPLRSERSVMRM
jgi:hypothetical protein